MPESVKMPIGIPGVDLKSVDRELPAGEPPPLPPNSDLSVVGKPTPRIDGRAKVTGAAKYTADVKLPGMLYARMISSPFPHAKVKSIDVSAAEKARGVKAVHVLGRVMGVATVKGEDAGKYPLIRFAGQPIAAVAAVTQQDADEAARLVKIEYEALPFVVSPERAMEDNAPVVFAGQAEQSGTAGGGGGPRNVQQKGNVRGPSQGGRGDVDAGFAEAAVTVEAVYRTQVQTHSPLETHGVVADWKPDGLTVYASTQGTSSVRDELAAVFGLKRSQVRVITEYMGGGFGAKFGAGNSGVLATHLSKLAGAPVRLMFDRRDEHLSAGNRPSSVQKLKLGAKSDGTLVAVHLSGYGTGGVGTGAGFAGPTQNMYTCANVKTEESDVFTNAGPAAAFRAPGHPQGAFSLEQSIDELAEKLKIDPVEYRDKIDPSPARREERKIGADKFSWKNRKPAGSDSGNIKRGMGFAQAIWYRFANRDAHCEVRITQDGSVEVLSGVQDIGGGIRTALAQVVAEELGLKASDVTVRIGDTSYPPGPGSGGSVTTNSITPPARNAAWEVRKQLLAVVASHLGAQSGDELVLKDGTVSLKSDPSKSMSFKSACGKLKTETISFKADRSADYPVDGGAGGRRGAGSQIGGVQFAQVAVDVETGVIKVERVVAVHDCGRPINPLAVQSQVNGGVIQGISYALYENRILDRQTGVMVNPNLEQYKIAGAREMPEIETVLIENYQGRSSTDAAGIGEPATVPTAAAIANAVYNAIGVRVRELPMTPAVVLRAIAEARKGA